MAISKKRKKFWEVKIPLIKKTTYLYGFDPKELLNKIIIYDLTRIIKGKGALLKTKVKSEGEELTSVPHELNILPYFIKRAVRKGTDYVEDSFKIQIKDTEIQIKPFLVTRRKVSRAVKKELRNQTKEELEKYLKNKIVEEIFDDLLKNKLQKEISLKLKKVYPLSTFEIKTIKVLSEIKSQKQTKVSEEESEKKESEKSKEKAEKKPSEKKETKEETKKDKEQKE